MAGLGSYFGGNYLDEIKFNKAYKTMAEQWGLNLNPDDPEHHYDYRALWKETGSVEPDKTGHFDSKFKKDTHPNLIVDDVNTKTGEIIGEEPTDSHAEQIIGDETPKPLTHISTDPADKFTGVLSKIEYYSEKITWLEGISEEKNGLTGAGYDAYRYAISQYNKFVDEYNVNVPEGMPTKEEQVPVAMHRVGVPQRQRGMGEIPEYELDTKEMPKAVKVIDDWMQGAMKGIPLGIAGFEKSFAGLMKEYGDITELMADPSGFEADPRWEGADEKFFKAMYGGGRFKEAKAKVGTFINQQGQKIVTQADEWSKRFIPKEDASEIEKFSADLHAGAVSLAGAVGFSVLTGSTGGAATLFGLAARGGTYLEAREAGVGILKSSALAGVHQVTETALEFIGLEVLFTRFTNVPRVASLLIKGFTEYGQEYSQEVGGNLVAIYGWDKLIKWNENAHRSGLIGFVLGIGAGGVIDYVSSQENAPKNVIKVMVEKTYQETLRATENIDHQDIIDSTQDYTMDVEPVSAERYDSFLEQSTGEILDQIDTGQEMEIPEQYTVESDKLMEEAMRVKPVMFTGKAFRAETRIPEHGAEVIGKMKTAREKLNYDYGTTGNFLFKQAAKLAESLGIKLDEVPIKEMVWVAPKKEIAQKYGEAKLVDLPTDTIVLAKDEEGGILVLQHADKYMKVEPLTPDTVYGEGKEARLAEGEVTDLTVTDVGTEPAVKEQYGLQVEETLPDVPIPPKGRKEWEPVKLPPMVRSVAETLTFKEPTLTMWYTPKLELMRQMGVSDVLGNLPEAYLLMDLKAKDLNHEVNELIKKLNKGRGVAERFGTWIKNKPSKQVARLRDLLDSYEEVPEFLTFEEKELFSQVRDLTTNLLKITNEFRKQAGLPPIHNLEAYIPHFLDEVARAAANGWAPYVQDVHRWTGKKVPKRSTNPTARHRTVSKLTDMLNDVFSKDLGMLLKAMIKYDLRDIYLAIPYAQVRANIKALEGQIPEQVLRELEEYMEYDIFDHQTPLDKLINNTFRKIGIEGIINLALKPFNRVVTDDIRLFSGLYRQGLMGGAIALKGRIVNRNLFQRLLTLDFVSPIDFVKAQFYSPAWLMDKIRETTFYKKSVETFEDLPPLLKPVQWGMYPFQKSHAGFSFLSNIDVAMKAGYWSGQRKIDWCQTVEAQQEIKDHIAKRPDMTQQEKDNLVWREGDQIAEAVEIGSYTQWAYFSTEMPRVFRGHGARAFWSLQSWTMNYFGKHVPEMMRRTFKGVTGRGRIVPKAERWRAAKGLAYLLVMLGALKKATGIDMIKFAFFPFPSAALPHLGQIATATYQCFLALTDEEERKGAWSKLKKSLQLLLPFSGAIKRYVKFLRGDLTLKEWLFYTEQDNEWKQIWIKTTPESKLATGDIGGTIGDEGVIGEQGIVGDEGVIGEQGIIGEE